LFGPAGWIPGDGEVIQSQGDLGPALPIEKLEFSAGGQKLLQALAGKSPPSGPHHQHHHAGVHQQGAHPPHQAFAGR